MTAAAAYGLGAVAPPVVAARGQQGVVWRVPAADGSYAVKELLGRVTEHDVALDVALQSAMVGRGVLTPRPLRTQAGDVLVPVGDLLFRAFSWLELEDERRDLDAAAVLALLGTLHRDPLPAPAPVDPWYTDPVPDQDWEQVAAGLAAAGAPFAREFSTAVPQFRALRPWFRPPAGTQLCHRDLWAGNVRGSGDGVCVIDWDNGGPAEAAQELAMPLVDFCQGQPDRARRLYRGYLDAGGPARFTGRGDFTMVLAQFAHFAVTAGQRWLSATGDEVRSRAEAWFREGDERPLDLRSIDDLLDAVRAA